MIIVRLWGGIGNQLFQYAFGEYLRNKTCHDIKYDISSFGRSDKLRGLGLALLNHRLETIDNIHISHYTGVLNRLFVFLFNIRPNHKFILENCFSESIITSLKDNAVLYLQGYWQKEQYAQWLMENKSELFEPKEAIPFKIQSYFQIANDTHSVALHVRRGDYFQSKYATTFGVCTVEYYQTALELISTKIDKFQLLVFSDDLEWVKENLRLPKNSVLVENYDIEQYWYIYLMSKCKHNIISNSSFSWWGAFLNSHKNKVVISPKKWLNTSDITIALDSWIKI